MTRRGCWAGALAAGLMLGSVARSDTPVARAAHSAGTNIKNACAIVSTADVKATLGQPVSAATPGAQGAFYSCAYAVTAGVMPLLITDESTIKSKTPYSSVGAYWKLTTTTSTVKVKKTVKKLGDKAVWMPHLGELWVLKGKVMFSVSDFPVTKDTLGRLTNLAKRVLKHL